MTITLYFSYTTVIQIGPMDTGQYAIRRLTVRSHKKCRHHEICAEGCATDLKFDRRFPSNVAEGNLRKMRTRLMTRLPDDRSRDSSCDDIYCDTHLAIFLRKELAKCHCKFDTSSTVARR